ncbi:MAG: TonB-dependent receptor [Bacteroides sp.]|nr:TonB-dependent receptor [Bacteroides sp.]
MALCAAFPAFAQTITVKGTVVDKEGEPLIGASVVVQGETLGTATDFDGNFSISAPSNGTLVVSYVGYETQEIAINGRTEINVTLHENSVLLGEVVAIGYGVVKKSDATGSVAVIKPDDIEAGIATSTQDLLVGASPGVVVTMDGGKPTGGATIRIRGGSSLSANNNPLVVIDGVPMTDQSNAGGTNALTMVNPQDIETMTILKDASATAIYGSRASNGVIIITTKKGQSGAPKVNFAANFHVNTARKTLDMMSASELRPYIVEYFGEEFAKANMGDANTDWQKEVLRTSFSQDYSLSVAGQAAALPYRVSASYTDNQGILKTSGMERTTAGINLSPKFFNGLLSVNANLNGTFIKSREADTGAIGTALSFNPSLPVRKAYPTVGNAGLTMFNGYTNLTTESGAPNQLVSQNPVQLLDAVNNRGEVWQSNGNLQIDYALHFLPELHFNLNLGYQVSKNQSWNDTEANSIQSWRNQALANFGAPGAATHYKWYELQRNTLLDFYANYRKNFEAIKSNVDVMVGYSWQKFDYHGRSQTYVASRGFKANGVNPIFNNGTYTLDWDDSSASLIGKAVNDAPMQRWGSPVQLISFFGRLNYTFDDTYLLTFTLRDDASSRFHKDNRWGLFPSVALGWKIINMDFMEGVRGWWNDFKLRLGWGVTGQQDIGSYFPYLPIYTSSYQQGFQYIDQNGNWINPLYPQAYDSNIKWEETTTWNVGLDFAFMNNRFTVAADWYRRETKDLLCNAPTVGINTSNYLMRNVGSLRNTGVEFNIGGRPVVTKDFTWNTGLNVAYNDNKITKLDGESTSMPHNNTPGGVGSALTYWVVGEPADTYMVFEQVYDKSGNPLPGQYVDQDGDGEITTADKIKFHSPDPKWTFSWNNTLNYKNWDFGIVLRANLGNYVYNGPRYSGTQLNDLSVQGIQINNMMRDEYLFPRQTYKDLALSNYWIENASFIRCDNISLGYTFNNLLNDKLNLRLFGVVQNPFVITKYKGIDPEVYGGIDNNVYPRPITVTFGLVANF